MNPSDILQVAGGVAILAIPVLGVLWLIVHSIRRRGKIAAAYQTFAQQRGLAFLSPMPFPQLHGQVDGREFVIGNFPHARNPQAFEFRMALGLRDYERLEATLYNAVRTGPAAQNRDQHPDFEAHLRGRVAWVTHLDEGRGRKLQRLFEGISWSS